MALTPGDDRWRIPHRQETHGSGELFASRATTPQTCSRVFSPATLGPFGHFGFAGLEQTVVLLAPGPEKMMWRLVALRRDKREAREDGDRRLWCKRHNCRLSAAKVDFFQESREALMYKFFRRYCCCLQLLNLAEFLAWNITHLHALDRKIFYGRRSNNELHLPKLYQHHAMSEQSI